MLFCTKRKNLLNFPKQNLRVYLLPNHISMAFSYLFPAFFLKEEILFRINLSKKMISRVVACGASPTLRLFLSNHMAYNAAWKQYRRRKVCRRSLEPVTNLCIRAGQWTEGLTPSNPLIVPLQTFAEKEHSKNKWSQVSMAALHSQQIEFAWGFHLSSLSPVDNLLWTANQLRKENLGVASLNQIPLNQETRGACTLIKFHVWDVKNTVRNSPFSRIQRQLSSLWDSPSSWRLRISLSICFNTEFLSLRRR